MQNLAGPNLPDVEYYRHARPFFVSLVNAPQKLLGLDTKSQTYMIEFIRAIAWYDWRVVCPYQCIGQYENASMDHAWTYEGRSKGFNPDLPDTNVPCSTYLSSAFDTPGTTYERFSKSMWVPDVVPQGQVSQVLPEATTLYDNVLTLKGLC